jgi:hypothetical protein
MLIFLRFIIDGLLLKFYGGKSSRYGLRRERDGIFKALWIDLNI